MPHRYIASHVRDALTDSERLRILALTDLMDSSHEDDLDRWAEVAAEALQAPVALISLVDDQRQFFKSVFGLVGWAAQDRGTPLTHSFCQYVVTGGRQLAVGDARRHDALHDNPAIVELGVVAYAGSPIVVSGQTLGALCVMEPEERAWDPAELRLLDKLAEGLSHEIALRVAAADLSRSAELMESHNRIHELIASDRPLPSILEAIIASIETHDPELQGSILLLDPARGQLFHGAASALPASYQEAIDGVAVGPASGSCGAAAWSGHETISPDLREDPRWDAFRHLTEPLGLRHCWSFPIVAGSSAVLGTFGVYGHRPRSPADTDRRFLRDAAKLAGIAIERRQTNDRLVFDATHDDLTRLANRDTAADRLDELLAHGSQAASPVSVLFIDLDRVKPINDLLGHETGDLVIRQAARRLRECAGPDDVVARQGGEEFLLASTGDDEHAADLARGVLAALRAPLSVPPHRHELAVTASIGITVVTEPGVGSEVAIRRADTAMSMARSRGGNQYAFGDSTDAAGLTRRLLIENALRHAIERDELSLVYQPLQDFADGRTVAVEALVRWWHPDFGQVGPDEFIPVAEQTGLIGEIGAWVLDAACAELPALAAQHGPDLRLAINVSAQQLRDPAFPDAVASALDTNDLAADRLYLEITETSLLASDDITTRAVRAVGEIGVHIALDDFGTGYSSLAVLKRYPIKAIKIDRSFVAGLPTDHDDLVIVAALIGMGHSLGLGVVAEGIETPEQYDVLSVLGCDLAQGYLIGRPEPAATRVPAGTGNPG
ncbi:MAG TPA: EAL domain-containing protein [Baekduia sp.]|nr:EAL domain-containing protein [Baekduia sp.]